jgi:hypothetical protein
MDKAVATTHRRHRRRRKDPTVPRSLLWILGTALFACILLLGYRMIFDSSSEYDRAMSNCISEHTQGKESLSGEEVSAIAASCASSMPAAQ